MNAELQTEDAERFSRWPVQAAPEGESAAEVARRVRDYLGGLEAPPRAHIALVTHGVVITALLAELLGWNLAEAWAERRGLHGNTALTTLQGPGETWKVCRLACSAHLPE